MSNFDTFAQVYTEELIKAVTNYPKEYAWPLANVPTVAKIMLDAVKAQTYSKDGRAFKNTCKRLNIKCTYKDINNFINGN